MTGCGAKSAFVIQIKVPSATDVVSWYLLVIKLCPLYLAREVPYCAAGLNISRRLLKQGVLFFL